MKRLMILAALLVATTQAQANSAEDCKMYTAISTGVLEMRQQGMTKKQVVSLFEDANVYNEVSELAVIRAFNADAEVDPEDFRASTFKRCRANEL